MESSLKLVKPMNSLLLQQQVIKIITHVKKEFDGIDFATLKDDEQFILHICEIVENIFTEKRIKKRKKEFVLKIIIGIIVDITDNDRRVIEDKIEFLHSNNVIKKVPTHTKAWNKVTSMFEKKS
jgi:hypothetical protein